MTQSPQLNTSAPRSASRLRSARVADGVVAGYIRELSRPQPDLVRAVAETARSGATAGRRFRGVSRRRSHGGSLVRPVTVPAGCSAA